MMYSMVDDVYKDPPAQSTFFNAQGDLSNDGPYFGTSIYELKKKEEEEEENDIDDSSLFDDVYSVDNTISHNECINKFVKGIVDDNTSMMSYYDSNVYDHIKKCKYCKVQINDKIKRYYNNKIDINNTPKDEGIIEPLFSGKFIGYDMKEIILIIIIGVIVVFILDLLVKIGKKIN